LLRELRKQAFGASENGHEDEEYDEDAQELETFVETLTGKKAVRPIRKVRVECRSRLPRVGLLHQKQSPKI